MIKKVLMVAVLIFISCKTYSEKGNTDHKMDSNQQIESVKNLTHRILTAQKNGDYYALTNKVATPKMISGLNASVQKQSYIQIKNLFGAYKDLKFDSIEEVVEDEAYKVYRFKGNFEFGLPVEIRSVMNSEGKLAGFFVKPWQNKL